MADRWTGLEDCIELLKTGKYEVLQRSEDGERFVFPITEPELHKAYEVKSLHRAISSLADYTAQVPDVLRSGYFGWFDTDGFILHMKPGNCPGNDDSLCYVGRFSYEPESGEFLPANIQVAHNTTIKHFGTHQFNEYVRGIYLRKDRLILLRAYYNPLDKGGRFDPYKPYDPDEDRQKMLCTLHMLSENGLPDDITIITRANNDLIKNTCLKGKVNFI